MITPNMHTTRTVLKASRLIFMVFQTLWPNFAIHVTALSAARNLLVQVYKPCRYNWFVCCKDDVNALPAFTRPATGNFLQAGLCHRNRR
jgi:hypothetical protein